MHWYILEFTRIKMSIYMSNVCICVLTECIVYYNVEKELGMFSSTAKRMLFLQTFML
jgi:hypothetical protein